MTAWQFAVRLRQQLPLARSSAQVPCHPRRRRLHGKSPATIPRAGDQARRSAICGVGENMGFSDAVREMAEPSRADIMVIDAH